MTKSEKARSLVKALVTKNLEFEFESMPFRLKKVPDSKLLTLMRTQLNCRRHSPGNPLYPIQLQIEPSSCCTLKCPVCPAADGAEGRPRRMMPIDTFKSLIDEVGDHASIAILWMWGEPLINTHFPDMVAYAHRKKVATLTSTNGQHIQTVEDAEALVSSGLDGLIVALDGATQETYSRYRIGGDINRIFRCLDLVCRAKRSLGSQTPWVNVRTVVNRENEPELGDIERIALQYGANMVTRKTMAVSDLSDPESAKELFPVNPFYMRSTVRNGILERRSVDDLKCRRPWSRMTVNAGGVVLPCEFDFNAIETFGQGGDGLSFLQAWRGAGALEFRRRFIERKSQFSFCANCTFKDGGSFECTVEKIYPGTKISEAA